MSAPATLAALEAQETAPPPMPATVEATGLAPDRLEQLLTKTLYVGEATGHIGEHTDPDGSPLFLRHGRLNKQRRNAGRHEPIQLRHSRPPESASLVGAEPSAASLG